MSVSQSQTGFNSCLVAHGLPITTVRYLPFLQAPPSHFNTIYTTLLRLVQLSAKLGQQHILVTADMAIYAKAQEILWAKPKALDGKVTMRLGGMHFNMAFLASLGHIYGDAGLLALLSDSDVYAQATARQMLQGKQYARGVRGIKLVLEALFRSFYNAMECWMETTQDKHFEFPDQKLDELQDAFAAQETPAAIRVASELEQGYVVPLREL